MLGTLAMLGGNLGLSLADRFIGSRQDKRAAAEQSRKEAFGDLVSSLSTRRATARPQQQQRQQDSSIQALLKDPLVRELLSEKLGGLTMPENFSLPKFPTF